MKKIKWLMGLNYIICLTAITCTVVFADVTATPNSNDITSIAGIGYEIDEINVANLTNGDIVKVYNTSTTSVPVAVTVADGSIAKIILNDLGKTGTKLYLSVTNEGKTESIRTVVVPQLEPVGTAPAFASVAVNNYPFGTLDLVTVNMPIDGSIKEGDVIRVYTSATALAPIGATKMGPTDAKLFLYQLGDKAGKIYISSTQKNNGSRESTRTEIAYAAEPVSKVPAATDITIVNNLTGTDDVVTVNGVSDNDIVKIYSAQAAGVQLATDTIGAGETSTTIKIPQIGTLAGKLYVSVKSTGKLESKRIEKPYSAEPTNLPLQASSITVTNNYVSISDTVKVSGLSEGDTVKVYSAQMTGILLGTGTVVAGETSTTVSIPQIGEKSGSVYVSTKSIGKLESTRIAKSFLSEPISVAPLAANIAITNNYIGTDDTIVVLALAEGDTIKAYTTNSAGVVLGTAIVQPGETSATIKIPQLGMIAGRVYVSYKKSDRLESIRVEKAYSSEPTTTSLLSENIVVTNNVTGTEDTVLVSGLLEGDIVKIYNAKTGTTTFGTGTVTAGNSSVLINTPQLGIISGKIYVTVKNTNQLESLRTEKVFLAEPVSKAPLAANITVTNNKVGVKDTIEITGLVEGNIVKVYNMQKDGTVLGTATVLVGDAIVTMNIDQLSVTAGNVYVSVKEAGKLESARTVKAYTSESSFPPVLSNIVVTNNYVGTDDTIVVSTLAEGDIIKVYKLATGGVAIATATVQTGETSVTFAIPQLGSGVGSAYISRTGINKQESIRANKIYTFEPTTQTIATGDITITNNYFGTDDTIFVNGLLDGDIVKIYDSITLGTVIASGTVGTGETSIIIKKPQLGTTGGAIYISRKNTDKLESARVVKTYLPESATAMPQGANITITNNTTGTDDSINFIGLIEGDIVKVYRASAGGIAIATGTVAAGETTLTITTTQLGTSIGTVYISNTSLNKTESARVAKAYIAE